MKMTDKLNWLLKQRGLSRKQFSDQSGIPYMTIINFYEKGTDNVKLSTLKKVARFFDVSLDYIANDNIQNPAYGKNSNFTPNEHGLVKKYRTLDEHGKTVVDCLLSEEYKRMTNDKTIDESNVEQEEQFIMISLYPIGASAGTGLWLFDDIECTNIQIPYTDESRRADFALPVRGDSMEPKYHDGDLLLVRQQPAIDIGEIGIFVLNDEGYVKKQGEHGLISLNDSYDDINISEFDSIYCKGKVVGCILAEEAKKYLP